MNIANTPIMENLFVEEDFAPLSRYSNESYARPPIEAEVTEVSIASATAHLLIQPTRQRLSLPLLPLRLHRGWQTIWIGTARCDLCNRRSCGVLQNCVECKLSVCYHCVTGGALEDDGRHSAGIGTMNWLDNDAISSPAVQRKDMEKRKVAEESIGDGGVEWCPNVKAKGSGDRGREKDRIRKGMRVALGEKSGFVVNMAVEGEGLKTFDADESTWCNKTGGLGGYMPIDPQLQQL